MSKQLEDLIYESPKVEVMEIQIEQGFAASGGYLENPSEGDEIGW